MLSSISGTGIYVNNYSMFGDAYILNSKSLVAPTLSGLYYSNAKASTEIGSKGLTTSYEFFKDVAPTGTRTGSFVGSITTNGFFNMITVYKDGLYNFNFEIKKNGSIVYFKSGLSSSAEFNLSIGSYTSIFSSGDVFSIYAPGSVAIGSVAQYVSGTYTGSGFITSPGGLITAGSIGYVAINPTGYLTQPIYNLSGNVSRIFTNFIFKNNVESGSFSINYLGSIVDFTNKNAQNLSGLNILNGGSVVIKAQLYSSGTIMPNLFGYGGKIF
jgi:hypothetical protein